MKTILQHAKYFARQGVGLVPGETAENPAATLINGCRNLFGVGQSFAFNRKSMGILYADVADYVWLTEQDEEGTHLRLIESMNIVKQCVAKHGGRTVHCAGDAILAEFRDAGGALECAIEVQLAARQWNIDLDLTRQVRFRIGVNFGEVISSQGDIFGKAVNLAARLEGLACAGGICVSEAVLSKLAQRPSYKVVALGKQYVKNISEPVQAFWIDPQQYIDTGFNEAVKVSAVAS